MDVQNLAVIGSAGLNLLLGIFIFLQNPKKVIHKTYLLLALGIFLWGVSMVSYRLFDSQQIVLWSARFVYSSAIIMTIGFYVFSLAFSKREMKLFSVRNGSLFVIVLGFILFYFTTFTSLVISNVTLIEGGENILDFGILYLPYVAYTLVNFSLGFVFLLMERYRSKGIRKKHVWQVFLGSFVASGIGLFTNLILPTFGIFDYNWVAQISSLALVVFIGYSITRYNLLGAKTFAVQLFILALLLISFLELFAAQDFGEFLLRALFFGGILFFSLSLWQSFKEELRRKKELETLSRRLKKANTRLIQLDKTKSEFVSIASHQLRTPLTAVKGFISLILEGTYGNFDKGVRTAINKVYDSNERLIILVEDLLNVSRIESGRVEYRFRLYSLEDLTQEVYDIFEARAKAKGLKFIFEKPKKIIPKSVMDDGKIREVLSNIVDNAIKYTQEGEVKISLKKLDKKLQVIIKDTGAGIKKGDEESLFEKFERGSDTGRLHAEGTGLGLYIGRSFVQAHNGKIWVKSAGVNKGSTFYVELPIRKSAKGLEK